MPTFLKSSFAASMLVWIAVAQSHTHVHAGGTLSDGRYEDDFNGGPLIAGWMQNKFDDGWSPAIMIPEGYEYANERLMWADAFQSPFTTETIAAESDAIFRVEFDHSSPPYYAPETMRVEFSTIASGVVFPTPLIVTAGRILDTSRFVASVAFSQIPKQAGGATQSYGVSVRLSEGFYGNYCCELTFDNFVMDWRSQFGDTLQEFESSSGWIMPTGLGGSWTHTSNGLSAIRDDSEVPEVVIDAWSPEFRFTNLSQALLDINAAAYAEHAGNDQLFLDLYRVSSPEIPTEESPAIANLTTLWLGGLDYDNTDIVQVDILQDAFAGEIPEGHVDNESIYRIRTRVYDNDTEPWTTQEVHIDNITITNAVLNVRGDYDSDADVDGRDFLVWQRGESPDPLSPDDLAAWQANYGSGPPVTANLAVPEPRILLLLFPSLGWAIAIHRS